MTDTDRPKRQIHITGTMMAFAAVAVLAVLIIVGWATSGNDEPTSEQRLCDLLRGGATSASLVRGDAWRTWPDSYSKDTRERLIRVAADQGGCSELVF